MFKLFQSLFDRPQFPASRYPDEIVEMAIERAVDATDSRLRAVPGYRKKLKLGVLKAIDHVVALVDDLPVSTELSPESYSNDDRLTAIFMSVDRLRDFLSTDRELVDALSHPDFGGADQIHALLLTQRSERRSLGMEIKGDQVMREVAQTTVSFNRQRLVDPSTSPEILLKYLRRRAFDTLLQIALARIAGMKTDRAELNRQKSLLERKLNDLAGAGWGFEQNSSAPLQASDLEADLGQVETQLAALGGTTDILEAHLEALCEELDQAHARLWAEPKSLIVDRMGVQRDHVEGSYLQLELQDLHTSTGIRLTAMLVRIPRAAIPKPKDFLTEASKYLG